MMAVVSPDLSTLAREREADDRGTSILHGDPPSRGNIGYVAVNGCDPKHDTNKAGMVKADQYGTPRHVPGGGGAFCRTQYGTNPQRSPTPTCE